MDTCVRGFSFMPDSKTELQYVDGGELERTWRSARRERMKKREQNIWDSFVKEKDAVEGVCKDDPYQFLEPLPESCMKEIMEGEPSSSATSRLTVGGTVSREVAEEEVRAKKEQAQHSTGDNSSAEEAQHTCVVTFADDMDKEEREMFYMFEDDQSGGEDEVLNDSNGPDTVRENLESAPTSAADQPPEKDIELQKSSSKSSENIASAIENSIYCARVKELRAKINEELLDLMTSLDRRDILLSSETEDIARMVKRSAEFCNRFNRIYMYQLQRQIHDIKRNSTQSLPFAKHTQFQAQMGRIASLHQNLLQSFMVFHKSFSQTCCVRESAGALGSLLAAVRDSTHMCRGVPAPRDFTACQDVYNDDLLSTCDKVDEFVNEYAIRCEEFLNRFETDPTATKTKKKDSKTKKRPWNNRNSIKGGTESQLSMYSMYSKSDNLRLNHVKSASNYKEGQSGSSSKMRLGSGTSTVYLKKGPAEKKTGSSPKRYRPLMRDPHAGQPRAPKRTRDADIRTMVEAVETCASSHISCEDSPRQGARPHKRAPPPRAPPAPRPPHPAPHTRVPRAPPSSRHPPATNVPQLQLSLRVPDTHTSGQKKSQPSSRPSKPSTRSNEPSSRKSRPQQQSPKCTIPSEDTLSSTRNEPEPEEQQEVPSPVLSVKCARKQEFKEEEGKQETSGKESPHTERERTNDKKKASDSVLKLQVYEYGECSTTVQKCMSPSSRSLNKSRAASPSKMYNREMARESARDNSCSPDRSEVTRLLKQLCSGDGSGSRTERVSGSKNVQLVHISGMSPRQPSTPQLLRILEETIKKKVPKPLFKNPVPRSSDRYRLQFNIDEKAADALFQYRTKFVQHMLTSAMYANSAVGKPWEVIGNVSEHIIDELLLSCVSKMEIRNLIEELFRVETC